MQLSGSALVWLLKLLRRVVDQFQQGRIIVVVPVDGPALLLLVGDS